MNKNASAFHQVTAAEVVASIPMRSVPMPPPRRSGLFCEKGQGAWQRKIARMKVGSSSMVLSAKQFESFRCAVRRMGAKLRQQKLGPDEIRVWVSALPQGEN